MAILAARAALGRIFFQRCFYLFVALLVLVVVTPLIDPTPNGRIAINVISLFVIVSAVATLGQRVGSFVLAVLLAVPTLALQWDALKAAHPEMLIWSWVFASGLYFATLVYLLRYVFQRDVMTADRLWGAAGDLSHARRTVDVPVRAGGAFLPGIVQRRRHRQRCRVRGLPLLQLYRVDQHGLRRYGTALQASAIAVRPGATHRSAVRLDLIARLAGVYPPQQRNRSSD